MLEKAGYSSQLLALCDVQLEKAKQYVQCGCPDSVVSCWHCVMCS